MIWGNSIEWVVIKRWCDRKSMSEGLSSKHVRQILFNPCFKNGAVRLHLMKLHVKSSTPLNSETIIKGFQLKACFILEMRVHSDDKSGDRAIQNGEKKIFEMRMRDYLALLPQRSFLIAFIVTRSITSKAGKIATASKWWVLMIRCKQCLEAVQMSFFPFWLVLGWSEGLFDFEPNTANFSQGKSGSTEEYKVIIVYYLNRVARLTLLPSSSISEVCSQQCQVVAATCSIVR